MNVSPVPGIRRAGAGLIDATFGAGCALILLFRALRWLPLAWRKRHEVLAQCFICGVQSLPVALVVGVFSGFILAMQTGLELQKYGQQAIVGSVVSITMVREFGPFMTGLICAANVGSAMAAELGTMKVSEEIDALEVMSIDPARFLVMPRVVAMTIMCPVLTIFSIVVGVVGGALIGWTHLGVGWSLYYNNAIDILDLYDVYTGLSKSVVFGCLIATVGCSQGLRAENGAVGVGQATRSSVIISFLLIIIIGFYMTRIYFGG